MQLMILFLGMLVAAIPFVLLSPTNTRFFVNRLAAWAAAVEMGKSTYKATLKMLNEFERQKREAMNLDRARLQQVAEDAGLTLTPVAGRVQ
jgi:hypothetical protein